MVYKINGLFQNIDLGKIFDKLSDRFVLIYYSGVLYAGIKSINDVDTSYDMLKQTLKPAKNFLIEKIQDTAVDKQPPVIKDWCSSIFTQLDIQRYEKEEQKKLKQVWAAMDKLESDLQQEMRK